jgi:hypothetical protein
LFFLKTQYQMMKAANKMSKKNMCQHALTFQIHDLNIRPETPYLEIPQSPIAN